MDTPANDLVVVGGGAAGLSAALLLGRAGRRVASGIDSNVAGFIDLAVQSGQQTIRMMKVAGPDGKPLSVQSPEHR